MKKLLLLLLFIPLVSFGQKAEDINKFPGTDLYTLSNEGESTIYDYNSYKIITTPWDDITGFPDAMGSQIIIYSKDDESFQFIGDLNDEFDFGGMVQNFIILDYGGMSLGDDNWFKIIDLQNQKNVFEFGYHSGFKIVNSKIEYFVFTSGKFTKPECSKELKKYGKQFIGYIEKVIFDLSSLKLERTGIYECTYIQ